jgi:hypothetical protein
VSHAPLVALRLASKLLRPFRPNLALAGMIGAAVLTDTRDMTFDPTQVRRDYPEIELTLLSEVVSRALP